MKLGSIALPSDFLIRSYDAEAINLQVSESILLLDGSVFKTYLCESY